MLVDPPHRYHMPQEGWVRLSQAIDAIPAVRQEFVDWLDYYVHEIDPHYYVISEDFIEIHAGQAVIDVVDACVKRGPPPSPERLSSARYLQVGKAVGSARFAALQALYEMISRQNIKVFARKHEQDADLQMMPPYVWEATKGLREASEAYAQLPSGKWYFDIHLGVDDATPTRRPDGLGPSHGQFLDWFVEQMKASPNTKTIKISEDGGQLLDKANELGVTFEKFKELKRLAFTLVPREVAEVWQKPGLRAIPRKSPQGG